MCGDANAMAWADAWIGHKPPQAPAPGNHWIETGPHVMVVGAKGMMDGHPRAAEHGAALRQVAGHAA